MSFTIHDIDKKLDARLSQRARMSGKSKNKLVKDILAQALGLPTEDGLTDDYGEFCGVWTEAEAKEFEDIQADNRKTDPRDWK